MDNITSNAIAVRVDGVSKIYRVWSSHTDRIKAPLLYRAGNLAGQFSDRIGARLKQRASSMFHDFAALTDISFELPRGGSLSVIGRNGAGKSTLLQIIAGTLEPTSGAIETGGRITALLELGSGFNPEFTGKDNVYLNGAILGLSKEEMVQKYEQIANFADIGEFIDQPVKFYSTGMLARLAFAVQVHVDPDVLIVDEVLSVGDSEFQAKALSKVEEILAKGTTLLYVGHDMNVVRTFCSRAIWLENGRMVAEGDPDSVISEYLFDIHKRRVSASLGGHVKVERRQDGFSTVNSDILRSCYLEGGTHKSVRYGENLDFEFAVRVEPIVEHPYFIFDVVDQKSLQITGRRIPIPAGVLRAGEGTVRISLQANFQMGVYRLRTRIVEAPDIYTTSVVSCKDDHLSFDVVDDSRELFTGVMPVPMDISWGEAGEP